MPSNRKKARRALKDFIQRTAEELPNADPADQYVRTSAGRLFLNDIRTLLDSEREARRAAAVQSRKAAEAARVVAVLQQENTDLRNNVSELAKQVQTPPGGSERWQELRQRNTSLAAQLDAHAARIWKLSEALSRAYTGRDTDFKKMYETARADAVEQRDRANRAETEVARQAGLLRGAHKDAESASVPDFRRLVEERGRKIRELTAERDREREHATRLAKKLDTLRAAPGTVNYQELYNELLPKAKRAERDLYNEQQRSARLQEALDSAAREAAPRTYADILREPDLRKIAQFLETFLKGGKK